MVHPIWQAYPEIKTKLTDVKQIMIDELTIKTPALRNKIIEYIEAPGKYIRSGLVLMFAQLSHDKIDDDKLYIAASIELLHLATLIHDDVIDGANQRRGIDAMHTQYSNRLTIYAGDYLMAYAFRLLARSDLVSTPSIINDKALENILKGEITQLSNMGNLNMSMVDYLRQIRGKTAMLFALSTYGGYYYEKINRHMLWSAFHAGQAIGMAFQLTDDLLDYRGSGLTIGKPSMQDINNGIYTAPLIIAMNHPDSTIRELLSEDRENIEQVDLNNVVEQIQTYNGFDETELLVSQYLSKANKYIHRLSSQSDTFELRNLLTKVINRDY